LNENKNYYSKIIVLTTLLEKMEKIATCSQVPEHLSEAKNGTGNA
jgi:hypothetical protein